MFIKVLVNVFSEKKSKPFPLALALMENRPRESLGKKLFTEKESISKAIS